MAPTKKNSRVTWLSGPGLEDYCKRVCEGKDLEAKVVHPSTVVTAPWVRWKCQFGCTGYGRSYGCPPDTPTPEMTRDLLDSYNRAVLIHVPAAKTAGTSRRRTLHAVFERLVSLEGEMFKDGFYKVFLFLAGPCGLCKECGKLTGEACRFGSQARPSMEACGIDVYQTARNNGFFIQPLREKGETQNNYCLLLVD